MNGVLYGVDTRAAKRDRRPQCQIGEDTILERCGNALTSQAVGPKILWFKRNHPELWAKTHKILTSTSYLTYKLTGRYVIDHYTAPILRRSMTSAHAGLTCLGSLRHLSAWTCCRS
jgi:xylulokinase